MHLNTMLFIYEKRILTLMVNNFTNINKAYNHLSPLLAHNQNGR